MRALLFLKSFICCSTAFSLYIGFEAARLSVYLSSALNMLSSSSSFLLNSENLSVEGIDPTTYSLLYVWPSSFSRSWQDEIAKAINKRINKLRLIVWSFGHRL